mgnify:CR=1 FL=1
MILNHRDNQKSKSILWPTIRHKLIEKISIVLGIITVIYVPIFVALNQYLLAVLLLPFIIVYLITYRINKVSDHLPAAVILIVNVNIGLLLYGHILGPESGIQYILFSLMVLSSLLLDPDNWLLTALSLSLSIISYVLIELNLELPIRIALSSLSLLIIKATMIFSTFIIIVMAIRLYYIQIKLAQTTIEEGRVTLESTIDKLKQAHSELKDFSHIVSHDIKNPLHSIDTLSKWLIEANKTPWTDELDKELLLINKNSIQGKRLVDGILTYSEMALETPQKELIHTDTCVMETWDMIDSPSNIQLMIDTPMPVINYNETQFRQLWLNLLGNSVRYMNTTAGNIHVGCTSANHFNTFYVLDNGPGVDTNEIDHIFKLFYSKGRNKGSGCGLAIVKKIVELNGGDITVKSSSDKGLCLAFSVPAT